LIRNGMEADWSWKHSAAEYTRLYEEIIRHVQASPVQSVVGEAVPLW
jgi:glycogen synthase